MTTTISDRKGQMRSEKPIYAGSDRVSEIRHGDKLVYKYLQEDHPNNKLTNPYWDADQVYSPAPVLGDDNLHQLFDENVQGWYTYTPVHISQDAINPGEKHIGVMGYQWVEHDAGLSSTRQHQDLAEIYNTTPSGSYNGTVRRALNMYGIGDLIHAENNVRGTTPGVTGHRPPSQYENPICGLHGESASFMQPAAGTDQDFVNPDNNKNRKMWVRSMVSQAVNVPNGVTQVKFGCFIKTPDEIQSTGYGTGTDGTERLMPGNGCGISLKRTVQSEFGVWGDIAFEIVRANRQAMDYTLFEDNSFPLSGYSQDTGVEDQRWGGTNAGANIGWGAGKQHSFRGLNVQRGNIRRQDQCKDWTWIESTLDIPQGGTIPERWVILDLFYLEHNRYMEPGSEGSQYSESQWDYGRGFSGRALFYNPLVTWS